jgi:inner membrane protein
MDPLTHAALGATGAHVFLGSRPGQRTWLIGALGGALPDADVLIRSASDPLLAIEYHRHFTHSLAFIPVGGALAALLWIARKPASVDWRPIFAAACLGYATHGLLDACTNYGTHLLWPFLPLRSAWHLITTIGPLLTLSLLIGLFFSLRKNSRWPALLGLLLGIGYIAVADVQRDRAVGAQARIAAARQQTVERVAMYPTVGNPFIWRSAYLASGRIYTDRLRVLGDIQWQEGSHVALFGAQDLPPEVQTDERMRRDFARFSYFSSGWLARAPDDPGMIGDARYSLNTKRFEPIWGIRFHPGATVPTEWVDHTGKNRIPLNALWREITDQDKGYQALPR